MLCLFYHNKKKFPHYTDWEIIVKGGKKLISLYHTVDRKVKRLKSPKFV